MQRRLLPRLELTKLTGTPVGVGDGGMVEVVEVERTVEEAAVVVVVVRVVADLVVRVVDLVVAVVNAVDLVVRVVPVLSNGTNRK